MCPVAVQTTLKTEEVTPQQFEARSAESIERLRPIHARQFVHNKQTSSAHTLGVLPQRGCTASGPVSVTRVR